MPFRLKFPRKLSVRRTRLVMRHRQRCSHRGSESQRAFHSSRTSPASLAASDRAILPAADFAARLAVFPKTLLLATSGRVASNRERVAIVDSEQEKVFTDAGARAVGDPRGRIRQSER